MREILAEGSALRARRGLPRGGRADLPRDGRDPEGRAPQGHPRGRDDHPLPPRPLHRPLPRAARPADRRRSARSSCSRPPASTGRATRPTSACSASTAPPSRSQKEMDEYLARLEQARARDHRRLGQELDLFSFNPLAPAMPFFHPKGAVVYNALVDYVRELQTATATARWSRRRSSTSSCGRPRATTTNYREAMFFTERDERQFAVKPMNCPTHCLIFGTRLRSYRDLPIRYADFGRLHRYERSGVTSGLFRVRSFSQDDAHIFCTEEQIEAEVLRAVGMILEVYRTFGFEEVRDRAVDPAGEADRLGRAVGPRRGGAGRRAREPAASPTRSTRATAPSTARRSTSTSRTPWAGAGSSARSSSTTSCRSASA